MDQVQQSADDVGGPRTPAGRRVYAIGDLHGELDLLEELLARIRAHADDAGPAENVLVFMPPARSAGMVLP
jgi:serine/threonine protein phosphatase 1